MIRKGDTKDANDTEFENDVKMYGRMVIVPYHSKAMKKGMEQAILKEAGLKK